MENLQEAKQLITNSKNIYIITSEDPEALCSALALFYTLKDLDKNVNLLSDSLPENLQFLSPSLDFISYPKNFVLSIPNNVAKISQIYYEKNDETLKVHLTVGSGNIKKDNIAFYFSEPKPDIIITFGIENYHKYLSEKLNSFGFLLDSTIINIDHSQNNQKFGKINIVSEASFAEVIFSIIENTSNESIPASSWKKETADCLLTGLVLYTNNFKNKVTAEVFDLASNLMKAGADLSKIKNNIKFS